MGISQDLWVMISKLAANEKLGLMLIVGVQISQAPNTPGMTNLPSFWL